MRNQHETQEHQIGVMYPDGSVKTFPHRHAADDAARQINEGLRRAKMPERAKVVHRHARLVTTVYAEPWQEVQR